MEIIGKFDAVHEKVRNGVKSSALKSDKFCPHLNL